MHRIMIAHSRFYTDIAELQIEGVKAVLDPANINYEIFDVPGSLEIPMAIKMDANRTTGHTFDGYLALGCVIRGETTHDEHVNRESFRGLTLLALNHDLIIANGILTVNTYEQARARADQKEKNRSGESARTLLRMIELKHNLRQNI